MPRDQRASERARLQRELDQRRDREATRKRRVMIGSVAGSVVVIAAIGISVGLLTTGGSSGSGGNGSSGGTAKAAADGCAQRTGAATASYQGVTVGAADSLSHEPKVSSTSRTTPSKLQCADLVTGSGPAAKPTDTVTVQYTGVLYRNGLQFDSSWSRHMAASFPLSGTVAGFTQGIGGGSGIGGMRVGSRRLLILPPGLAYGSQAQAGIPANSPLVFVVDLKKISTSSGG